MSAAETGVIILEEVPGQDVERKITAFLSPFISNASKESLITALGKAPRVLISNISLETGILLVRKLNNLGAQVCYRPANEDSGNGASESSEPEPEAEWIRRKRSHMSSGIDEAIENETLVRESPTLKMKLEKARKSKPSLVIILGKPLGKRFPLNSKNQVIGRASECDISIIDRSLSRSHAEIFKSEKGRYYIKDCGSTNGTYLNDRKVIPGKALAIKNGDFLKLGNMIFKFIAAGKIDQVFHEDMLNLATLDDLTGIPNRHSIMAALEEECYKAKAAKLPLSIIIFDLDDFKSVNDRFGHGAGDLLLKETAKVAQGTIRDHDFLGRFGGDEFMAILWNTSLSNAYIIAERIRSRIEKHDFLYERKKISVTISLGVSTLDGTIQSIGSLFKKADTAQYNAKRNGGNQVSLQ
ncbi:MAG: GGDEF domain-containing protein [Deltaproteobacteria bacterium]|jgi:two-component system cell cycle response regulator